VVATPATAQSNDCASGGCGVVSGVVWNDTNDNGIQETGEPGIEGVKVFTSYDVTTYVETDAAGHYVLYLPDDTYTIYSEIPKGTEPSPTDATVDTDDSDGVLDSEFSVAKDVIVAGSAITDFGFFTSEVRQPGTGTPGYWKNHPEAWTVLKITVGGIEYTQAQAISWLGKVGKNKLTTMFSSLVPAMLNVKIGNQDSCVSETIAEANVWMATYGPLGVNTVLASSSAWAVGEPMHMLMDAYNNGLLCAKHRN
jgi:hypothetical protein